MTDTESIPYERYENGVLVESGTYERPLSDAEITRREIVQTWAQRRAALVADYQALQAATPAVIAAHQALQAAVPGITSATTQVNAASTSAQTTAALKAYVTANNTALGALRDATNPAALGALKNTVDGTIQMLAVIEQAMAWLDAALADLQDEGD